MTGPVTIHKMRDEVGFSLVGLAVLGESRDQDRDRFGNTALLEAGELWIQAKRTDEATTSSDSTWPEPFLTFCEGIRSAVATLDDHRVHHIYEVVLDPERQDGDAIRLARILRDRFALGLEEWNDLDGLLPH